MTETATREWRTVTKADPCPICGKPDWCQVSARIVHCHRIESQRPAKCDAGGWIHERDGIANPSPLPLPPRKRRKSDAELATIWGPKARKWWQHGGEKVQELAGLIGVESFALDELKVGWDGSAWTFPERNSVGLIVGINRRLSKPMDDGHNKVCCTGSRRGLTYSDTWDQGEGPILIVEGGSDTAAGLTMGLCVIGRPSNIGGVEMLVNLLRRHYRKTIVVGERDRKPRREGHKPMCWCQCCWPGLYGAKTTAKHLAERLHRKVLGLLLPDNAKDLRAWYVENGNCEGFEAGKRLLERLR